MGNNKATRLEGSKFPDGKGASFLVGRDDRRSFPVGREEAFRWEIIKLFAFREDNTFKFKSLELKMDFSILSINLQKTCSKKHEQLIYISVLNTI